MRRNSDASRRNEDRYASAIAAVSQARDWIRRYEEEDEEDARPPARRPRFRTFGIGTATSEENTINLDPDFEPTHSPQPRHVPGTPYPQHLHLYNNSQVEPQRPPAPPSSFQAHQTPSVIPATTLPPPVSIPYQNMSAYVDPPNAGQFYQQPQRNSPFVVPSPLVPVPGLVATPMATSLTLPPSWAPNTPQMSVPYVPSPHVPSPAASWHHLQPPTAGAMAWQPYPYPYPGTLPTAAFWSTPALVAPSIPQTPMTLGQPLAMSGGVPLQSAQPSWAPVESWPPREQTLPVHLSPWLSPNPVNPDRPHVVWDVSEAPSKAQRISGKDIFVSMNEAFAPDATAVFPETDEIVVVCDAGLAQDMWPPIRIRKEKVTSGDVFWAIYEYFQKTISRDEVEHIKSRSEDGYRRLLEACYRRCSRTPGLADITRRQGVKRVDCLEGRTAWWGMWPVFTPDGTWSLHLSLMESNRA
ncbi:hypothetical protein H4582DRAFT_1950779 [Lactarius indigo]|nr:hypothetical protein H4582DRAFT_1950779 [Lactarius indigo]